ncbi:MAG TPA: hypothetical protein VF581_04630 [Flavobacterium sp.]|jgi:hypothetical protein
MADTLLLNTTMLAVKVGGLVDLPAPGKCNSAIVKSIVEMIKYGQPQILFVGNEAYQPENFVTETATDLIVKIHVIDAPFVIDFSRSENEIVKWFLRQIRCNKKHIVLQSSQKAADGEQLVIDIYMRGVFIPKVQSNVRQLQYQPTNRLNHAV